MRARFLQRAVTAVVGAAGGAALLSCVAFVVGQLGSQCLLCRPGLAAGLGALAGLWGAFMAGDDINA